MPVRRSRNAEVDVNEPTETLSCDPIRLYGHGGFHDHEIGLDRLVETAGPFRDRVEVLSEVYPGSPVRRPPPVAMIDPDAGSVAEVQGHFHAVDGRYAAVSPALLVRIRDAIVWNNMLFVPHDGRVLPLYEFYRPNDRQAGASQKAAALAACGRRETLDFQGRPGLFVGSAGSFNYGHWLTDDLPALACVDEVRRPGADPVILMSSFAYGAIDRIRTEGVDLALGERMGHSVRLLDFDTAYTAEEILYVTPASYPPFLKSPHALGFLRTVFERAIGDAPGPVEADRLFVNRGAQWWRQLTNASEVAAMIADLGYVAVLPEDLSLRRQWSTFAAASRVVGVMGAGMTSSLFSPPGSHLPYLAASGGAEPFFWDLAAMSRHAYAGVFGPDDGSDAPLYRRSFRIDLDALRAHLTG